MKVDKTVTTLLTGTRKSCRVRFQRCQVPTAVRRVLTSAAVAFASLAIGSRSDSADQLRFLALPQKMKLCEIKANGDQRCGTMLWSGHTFDLVWDDGQRYTTNITDQIKYSDCTGFWFQGIRPDLVRFGYVGNPWPERTSAGHIDVGMATVQNLSFTITRVSDEPLERAKWVVPGQPPACRRVVLPRSQFSYKPRAESSDSSAEAPQVESTVSADQTSDVLAAKVSDALARIASMQKAGTISDAQAEEARRQLRAMMPQIQEALSKVTWGESRGPSTPVPPGQVVDPNFKWPFGELRKSEGLTGMSTVVSWNYSALQTPEPGVPGATPYLVISVGVKHVQANGEAVCPNKNGKYERTPGADDAYAGYFGFNRSGSYILSTCGELFRWNETTRTLTPIAVGSLEQLRTKLPNDLNPALSNDATDPDRK